MNFENSRPGRTSPRCPAAPMVFVVDSDVTLHETLTPLLLAAGWQVSTAASAKEFLALPRTMLPCCLLVELDLSDVSGLVLQRLLSDRTDLPIIFMSKKVDVPATVQAMKAGAFEFLIKPLVNDVLLDAVGGALERSCAALAQHSQLQSLQERCASLSRREREVMNLLVRGRLNKQVGAELGISEITVKAHRGKMMRKMRAGSLAELVMMVTMLRRAGSGVAADHLMLADCTEVRRHVATSASHGMALLTAS